MRVRVLCGLVAAFSISILPPSVSSASEWSSPRLLGPSIKTVGRTAVTFRGSFYVFASTRREVLYRSSADGTSWLPRHGWESVDVETPSSPAAAVLDDTVYLFYRTRIGEIEYRTFDGSRWNSPSTTGATSATAPAVVTHGDVIYLAWRSDTGEIEYRTFDGSVWSGGTKLTGRTTERAPAITSFAGDVYIVVSSADGRFSFAKPPVGGWSDISCLGCSVRAAGRVSMVASNGKLVLFTTSEPPRRVLMRVMARTMGKDLFLPEDDWMDVGGSGSAVAAVARGRKVLLFFDGTAGTPGVPPLMHAAYGLSYQSADWTTIPLVVVQTADDNCSNASDLTNVPTWIRYTNLIYAPLLMDFVTAETRQACDVRLQAQSADGQVTFDLAVAESYAKGFPGRVVVYFRARANGGAFAGASLNYVAMPEGISVCDAGGTTSFSFFNNDLGHELGHYFGLPHTFHDFPHYSGKVPLTKAEAQQMLEDFSFDIVAAFDRDLEEAKVPGTPPDPLYEKDGVSDEKCTSKDAPVELKGAGGRAITLIPPRTNAMSYYQISGSIVNKLIPGQGSVVYRHVRSKLGL